MDHLAKGATGERIALAFLKKAGMSVVTTNYRSRFGEIDIICRNKTDLIFVEVRLRSNQNFGSAAETVNIHKQRKIIKTAQAFLLNYPTLNTLFMRFDVIGINAESNIEWIKGAFEATA